jgi:hypothetical protein
MQKIKFHTTVYSTQFGTLSEGDLLACSDAYAEHFVDELKVAKRIAVPAVLPQDKSPSEETPAPKRKRQGA